MSVQNLRKVYCDTLIRLAEKNPRIVSLDSDSREATFADRFAARFPERSFSFGIAEQDMVCAAGGMATWGLIPFVNSYAMFIAMRALDQVRNAVAYPNLNVKFVLSHHGLDAGADGVTHQVTEDIAIFRAIPNLTLLQPADALEMEQMIAYAVKTEGPMVIKSGKTPVPDVHPAGFRWRCGEPSLLKEGTGVALITTGLMASRALEARKRLEAELECRPKVIHLGTLSQVNAESLLRMTEGVDLILTLEDHSVFGGLGGLVCEIFSEKRPTRILRLGLGNSFAESGSPAELFKKYKMDETELVRKVTQCLQTA